MSTMVPYWSNASTLMSRNVSTLASARMRGHE
jgi:hypothetical protein